MNVCFHLLDDPVIGGRADDLVLAEPPLSFARLLEEVAAFGGVLRAVGVHAGDTVLVDLRPDHEALVAALATARLGGRVLSGDAASIEELRPGVVVTDRLPMVRAVLGESSYRPGTVVVHGEHGDLDELQELDWEVGLRAGRTDPAPAVELEPGAPYDARRTVADVVAASQTLVAQPISAERLRQVLLPA